MGTGARLSAWAYSKYLETKKLKFSFMKTRMHAVCQLSARSSPPSVLLGNCRHRKSVWNLSVSTAAARHASSVVARGWRHQYCKDVDFRNHAVRWWTWGSRTPQRLACCRQLSVTAVVGVNKEPSVAPGTTEAAVQVTATVPAGGEQSQTLLDSLETSTRATWATDATSVVSELPVQGDFTSVGLGGYSPIGIIQWSLEYLHVHAHLPWWIAIVTSTLVLRTLLLPVAINVQSNAARLNNIRPETERLMAKVRQYKQAGNTRIAEHQMAKVYELYAKHNCHPLKMMLMPVMQVPIFISFFIALRRMASIPVESMKTGGILWFTDLTVPDPYYILPVLGCVSFMAIIELGGEAGVTNPQVEKMKIFFRCMSILLIPVTASFPAGLFMYWLTASTFSMGQILLLKVPRARAALGIPKLVQHPPEQSQQLGKKKEGDGFFSTLKQNYRSAVMIDVAKKRESDARRAYEKMKKSRSLKLYDKPPHLRNTE